MNVLLDIVEKSRWQPETKSVYRRCVAKFLAFAGPDPAAWTAYTVERWRDSLVAGRSRRTVNKYLYALRYASKRFEALGYGPDFARAAETLRAPPTERREALTPYEARCLVAACERHTPEGIRDRALVTLGIRTGLRVSSLTGLRWEKIRDRIAQVPAKGGAVFGAVLDDACLAALADWRLALDALGGKSTGSVFVGIWRGTDDRPRAGKRLSRQALHSIVAERGKLAQIKRGVHPHLLRHTFVSWALQAGVPAQRVMAMTGHKNLATLSGYVTDLEAESDPVGSYLPELE